MPAERLRPALRSGAVPAPAAGARAARSSRRPARGGRAGGDASPIPERDQLEVVDDARVVVTPAIADRDDRTHAEMRRQVEREVVGLVARVGQLVVDRHAVERLARDRAEELAAGALRDAGEAGLAVVAVDRRE